VTYEVVHDKCGLRHAKNDAGACAQITETWKAQLNIEKHLQQGLLGLGRWHQQPLAGSTADPSPEGHR
jgi:hypothetical protein